MTTCATPGLALHAGQVHCWWVDLDARIDAALADCLDQDEQARAAAFRFPLDRHRYLSAHCALRWILGRYAGVSPRKIEFVHNDRGKPALANHALAFSLSHSGATGLIGVSSHTSIGVDVEHTRAIGNLETLAATVMHRIERGEFARLAETARSEAFYRLWTRKEAMLKALGSGFATDPQGMLVGMEAERRIVRARPRGDHYTVCCTHVTHGMVASLAVQGDLDDISHRTWPAAATGDDTHRLL